MVCVWSKRVGLLWVGLSFIHFFQPEMAAAQSRACLPIWQAAEEVDPNFGAWKPVSFHTNGAMLLVHFQNASIPVGFGPIRRNVLLMAQVDQPAPINAPVLVYQSDDELGWAKINYFGDVAFRLPIADAPAGLSYTKEEQLLVCSPQWSVQATGPQVSYPCAANAGAALKVASTPFSRSGPFGPNMATDGAITSLEWAQSGGRKLFFAQYRFSLAESSLNEIDLGTQATTPWKPYTQLNGMVGGGLPTALMRVVSVDPVTETPQTFTMNFTNGGFFPAVTGTDYQIHDTANGPGYVQTTTYLSEGPVARSIASQGVFSVWTGPGRETHTYFGKINSENTRTGLYYRRSTDSPAYGFDHRISTPGRDADYSFPFGFFTATGAVLGVTATDPAGRKGTEFYGFDPQLGTYVFDRAIAPPANANFEALFGAPLAGGAFRIAGMLEDITTRERRITVYDCL